MKSVKFVATCKCGRLLTDVRIVLGKKSSSFHGASENNEFSWFPDLYSPRKLKSITYKEMVECKNEDHKTSSHEK
jgi:hypothetical protein